MPLRSPAAGDDPDSHGHDELVRPGGRTPWRRNWGLGLVVLAGFVIGAPVSRLLETYRGVVLERQDERMFLGFEAKPPKWYDAIEGAAPGTIIVKDRGDWSVQVSEAMGRDIKLMQMQKRYTSEYDATIVRIDPPLSANQGSVAVAEVSDGTRIRVPLYADDLAGAAVGRHLRKFANSWDPVLIDEPLPATGSARPASPNAAPTAPPPPKPAGP